MNKIYYFTGTGNSLQIANDLSAKISECKIHKISEYTGEKIDGSTLGIVFPVYNWGLPLIICDFLKKLYVSNETYIYAIANYGGLPGKALDQCQDILKDNGLKLSAGFLINMPGNYILGYGAKSEKVQEKLFAKEANKIIYISEYVNGKKEYKIEKSHAIIDRLCCNYFYKYINEFHEADKYYTVDDNCIGCGLCARRCPVNNITMIDGKPSWNHHCELCVACIQSCPKKAIDYKGKTKERKQYLNPNVEL
ncbi:EFR1 family ferrodoxin [Clostridium weizhouense]|uniref:4Fe-4S dicluster domain-containing protein n=1 Tax=Clostridium weizhouense TaxID=2859781 RepID=A0ABS7AST2_9CLOT|nr:EFR1 family ferrodoxin [Clostridium weizhouense]MBW6411604.1 4Fe-4S dicluster domain-containing protein [Clostridium weizhouense]